MIIALSGYAQSGKDTVADILVEDYGYVKYAWADTLRLAAAALNPIVGNTRIGTYMRYNDVLANLGYNEAKTKVPEVRRILQVLGTEVGRNLIDDNVWVDATLTRIKRECGSDAKIVIADTRFPNEADTVRSLDAMNLVVRVSRPGVGPVTDHPSETALDSYDFDRTIFNDGTIEDLYESVARVQENHEKVR